ncbi:MAG: efflux RND transporter periplasmic adaptor subunit [Armatimonadetes bacterium]|nr:efflux RND transporter periplasmic adaptor subunit [Armatimonadota bacterium]
MNHLTSSSARRSAGLLACAVCGLPAVALAQVGAARPTGRPVWVFVLALLLCAGAVGVAVAARRRGARAWRLACGLLAGSAVVVVGGSLTTAAASEERGAATPAAPASPFIEVDAEAARQLGIKTEMLSPRDMVTTLEATGRIVPVEARQAHLGARISGRLTGVHVRVGDRVSAGQVVATLDSVDAAQAAAAYRDATARVSAAERHLATRRELVASGAFTEAPLEEARRNLAEARVAQAQVGSELAQARNELDSARAEFTRTERMVASGSYTAAAVEDARQKLAEAERGLAQARSADAEAEAAQIEAEGALRVAQSKVNSAQALLDRTSRLAATGEMDRAPLEQAETLVAEARSRLSQAEAGLEQARRQAQRGEDLYRAELVSLNDLEARRTLVREREAQRSEAASAAANAQSALARQQKISAERMTSGRAEQEARNTLDEARRELAAAEARVAKAASRVKVVAGGMAPAQAAVDAAAAALAREKELAGDKTRATTVLEAARLRVAQAERVVAGKQGEDTESARKAQVAGAAAQREERLATTRVRSREQLLESEREVRASRIARDNAAEVLALLGATSATAGARGPVQVPVRAPIAGLVTTVAASVGEAVSPEKDLMTVVDLSEVYVEADVYERDLPRVATGQLVRISVRSCPGQTFVGAVVSISGELDAQTRAAHVRALLPNPSWPLRPEMFATVAFITDRGNRVLTVPSEAVQEVGGKKVVFIQRTPTQYEMRAVTLGRAAGGRVEVVGGLSAGAAVVTNGSYLLKSQQQRDQLGEGNGQLQD